MSCQLFIKLNDAINDVIAEHTRTAKTFTPTELGLDPRCATSIYVQDKCVIIKSSNDRNLRYYGGFEYVEAEHRLRLGDYVIYSSESTRVQHHLQFLETEH